MDKKKTRKSKTAKSMRDLPEKTVNVKTAKAVKGGGIHVDYHPQKPDGTL